MSAEHYFKKALRRYKDDDTHEAKHYFKKASKCSDADSLKDDWKDLVRDKGLSTSEIEKFLIEIMGGCGSPGRRDNPCNIL
ncbi:hypothetical protein BpHYR1_041680 [Brachionus plicatilis]|uniref:Uncharacterized protein n=1 Tax=Brachionus plicatilis TaxID=10195 RepID=A0A3M7STI0_BRAPC|nr:hypothetical protein BpHYR1_041680 [Brachionus plicatilis]